MMPLRSIPFLLAALATTAQTSAMQPAVDADVEIEVEQFGVGNAYRPGAITGMRLVLTSSLDEPTPVWVQWEVPNAEGDVAEYGRSVVLNPGSRELLWLYAPLSPHTMDNTRWTVRVFEERDGRRRRELGGDPRISPARSGAARVELDTGMIAVVGRARMRLEDYSNTWNKRTNPPGAHESTRIVSGIAPHALPDRWEGLSAFEAVVWSDALSQLLRNDTASALREYIRRGGHLVIILPETGISWELGSIADNLLEDLLVRQKPRKDESVMLSELMPLLSKSRLPPVRDFEMSLRVFKDIAGRFDAIDNRYEPLMALGDGRVIAVQRLVDFGRITIIGIDLTSQRLASMRLPQADAFWNRILGRRDDTPQPNELLIMEETDPRMLTRGTANEVTIGDGRLLDEYINKSGQAARGLMSAVLLFIAYFVVAGPGGFFFLKQKRMSRHSWLVFAATAGVFTAVAWGGVRLLRQADTEFRHVTFLDHVVRPGTSLGSEPHYQRAVSWGSLYLPNYGSVDVSIESDPGESGENLLFTWEAPPPDQPDRFPNVDRYVIDVGRSPADYTLPVRATATQLYVNWLGALDPDWGGTLRVDQDDPIRVTGVPGTTARLSGTLINDLPGELRDVCVIWVSNTRHRQREYLWEDDELSWVPPSRSGEMLNTGHMWASDAGAPPWYPDTTLSLADFVPDGQTILERNIDKKYIEPEEGDGFNIAGMGQPEWHKGKLHDYMEMLSIYHQLAPPRYIREDDKDPETAVITRRLTRELDLSAWFTRPCLIIIGYLDASETPVPLLVDGETPRSEGLTVVRWIYPLPLVETRIVSEPRTTPRR